MFSYLRYFAVISLVLVVLGAVALSTFFAQTKREEMLALTTEQVEATVRSFVGTVWRTTANQQGGALAREAAHYFAPQPYAKTTLVSPDIKGLYYGSSNAYVTSDGTTRITLFDLDRVRAGHTAVRILEDVYLTGSANPNSKRMLIQLIVPLMSPDSKLPLALAEIYVDVSEQWHAVRSMQYIIDATMIGTFFVLVGMLLFTSWRAESIIARQHEVNLELTAAAASAEAQSRDKSQFLASISHELRTPLNAIIGFSDIIKTEARAQLDKTYQTYVDDIHASGKHLLSLINDILDYSKAEAGKLQMEWAETDANKVIRNSLRMVLPRAETAQVTLVEDIPNHHLVVVTDAKKLKQVLLNLLSNAVKFTPAGGAVRCHAWEDIIEKTLVIQVRDTGIGIAPKDISKVMTPFGQVDSALSRKYEGTGLGLPLSKKFVEALGGHFAIESELNVGTTVTITLPKQPKNWQASPPLTASEGEGDVAYAEQPAA